MTRYNGMIKCYKGKKHFGFIVCPTFNEGELFFSPGNMNMFLSGADRMRITKPGTIVNFDIIHKRRGYQANDIRLGRYDGVISSFIPPLSLFSSPRIFNPIPISNFETETFIPGFEVVNCTICLEVLDCGEFVTRLPCKHLFHHDCLAKWLQDKQTCPNCRENLFV